MTVKFPSGRRMYAHPGHGHTLDSTIHEFAVGAITEHCHLTYAQYLNGWGTAEGVNPLGPLEIL
jgi:hypothetical protein